MSEADFTVEALADFTYEIMAPSFIEGQEKPNYLYFHKGDRLKVLVTYENGWWYGTIEEEFEDKKDEKEENKKENAKGFFPSNYVVKLSEEEINYNFSSDSLKRKPEIDSWLDYAQQIMTDNPAELFENRGKQELNGEDILNEQQTGNNYNSVIGYKKIKISNDPIQLKKRRELFLQSTQPAPTPIVNNEYAMIPVKQQDPNSKAYRLLYHYFDYDRWIDLKNKGMFSKKAKPDIRKKKEKKKKLNFKY